ncbi:interferon a3-like [Cheilinus undulatus]|uniref:interferon a3-like n=1 Tax=Cheilinus undulatus TaxID=241271 RepID=UPI001BD2720F|nr:interferon a3-like [Cheilinus undulatus]
MRSWTSVFFVFCTVLTTTLSCDWLSKRFGHLSGLSLDLIQDMGGPLTKKPSPVPFPYRLYSRMRKAQVDSQLVFIRDSLDLISRLYQNDKLTSVTWNKKKLEEFQGIINRQAEELNKCVSADWQAEGQETDKLQETTENLLQKTESSSAASWELIRKETKDHLAQLDVMVNFIKASGAASRRRHTATEQHSSN